LPLDIARRFVDLPRELKARYTRAQDYRAVHATEPGKRMIADLLAFCGLERDPFVPGAADETAYALGKQRVARRIAAMLNLDEREIMRLAGKAFDYPLYDTEENSK